MEAREFSASLSQFAKLDAEVVGVSPDTPECHVKFRKKHSLGVRLLADPEHRTMAAYGAWGTKNMYGKKVVGVIRSTVLIGPDGKVAHHWKSVKAAGHAQHVRAKLAELRDAPS